MGKMPGHTFGAKLIPGASWTKKDFPQGRIWPVGNHRRSVGRSCQEEVDPALVELLKSRLDVHLLAMVN